LNKCASLIGCDDYCSVLWLAAALATVHRAFDRSAHVVCGDMCFPITLGYAQSAARRFECFDRGSVAGSSFGFRAQRQDVPRTEIFGKCLFSRLGQAFKFWTIV
jgi:hypothetical protein